MYKKINETKVCENRDFDYAERIERFFSLVIGYSDTLTQHITKGKFAFQNTNSWFYFNHIMELLNGGESYLHSYSHIKVIEWG